MSEPVQKCENIAIFKQNYAQKLFIAFKNMLKNCLLLIKWPIIAVLD